MNILKYFLIILIPPVLILGNFRYLVFNFDFYQMLYQKTGVYQSFDSQQVVDATKNLFGYFKDQNQLDSGFYSEQAMLHLADVKATLRFTFGFFYLLFSAVAILSLVMIIKKFARVLIWSYFVSSALTVAGILLLALGVFNFFDAAFLKFHQGFFTNNLWQFPPNDNLIKLFPREFFVEFANRLAVNIALTSLAIAFASAVSLKRISR